MNNKITFPELATLLALQSGRQKKVCEDFLKSFFDAIAGGLENGENVKVRGFGTFKITRVEARKSINVTTGQEFEIPAHNRVSFVAAKELASMVNAPFSCFETVELSEGVTEEMLEMKEEITPVPTNVSENNSLQEDDKEDLAEETISPLENIDENPISDEIDDSGEDLSDSYDTQSDDEVIEDVIEIEDKESPIEDEAKPQIAAVSTSIVEEEQISEEDTGNSHIEEKMSAGVSTSNANTVSELSKKTEIHDKAAEPESTEGENEPLPKKKEKKFGLGIIVGIILTLLVGIIVWLAIWVFSLREEVNNRKEPIQTDVENIAPDTVVTAVEIDSITQTEEDSIVSAEAKNQIAEKYNNPSQEDKKIEDNKKNAADTKPSDAPIYDKITPTYVLTTMARKYYGSYHLWPYIYEANPNLGHPNKIPPGTKIKIPALSTLGIDPKNKADIEAARKKATAIYARYNSTPDAK